jgi:hypothetical protein
MYPLTVEQWVLVITLIRKNPDFPSIQIRHMFQHPKQDYEVLVAYGLLNRLAFPPDDAPFFAYEPSRLVFVFNSVWNSASIPPSRV